MIGITRSIFDSQIFHVKYGGLMESENLLKRYVYFPFPIKTNLLRLNIVQGSPSLAVKIDLLGTSPEKSYRSDSTFEKMLANNGTCILNK